VGKRIGFSHLAAGWARLFPHNSTQVVDFPHLSMVRLLWEAMKWMATDGTRIKHGCGKDGFKIKAVREEGLTTDEHRMDTNYGRKERNNEYGMGRPCWCVRILGAGTVQIVRLYANLFAYTRTFSRISKKWYFFPALWPSCIGTQWVGDKLMNIEFRIAYPGREQGGVDCVNLPACQGGQWFV
jgi:hypothetical protein